MFDKIDRFSLSVRRARVVSITALAFTLFMTYEFTQWIMSTNPESLGEAAAVTGVMGTLAALVKFIFQFAASNETEDK